MKAFVTGARGFLGANLINRLKADGHQYVRYDAKDGNYLHSPKMAMAMEGCDIVFHLAANADIRSGWADPSKDLNVNTIGTAYVLEAMRANGIKRIAFASSSAVYGETINPAENCPWPVQTSLYGASKVAGEALCQAYAEGQGFEVYILRFVPLLGEGYRHGHVFDFVKQLLAHPESLTIQGNGKQRKAYIYVGDAIDASLHLVANKLIGAWNICGTESYEVKESAKMIMSAMGLSDAVMYFTGGDKGWVGDAPKLTPDCTKLFSTGWRPKVPVDEAFLRTVRSIIEQEKEPEPFK